MAQYHVIHSCAHEQTHSLFGKNKDREQKINWLETTPCTDCWKKQQDKERAEKQAEDQKKAEAYGLENKLAALTGTEKQIAWANVIRAQYMTALDKPMALIGKAGNKMEIDFLIETHNWLANITQAKWWIDNREPQKSADLTDILNYTFHDKTRAPKTSELIKHICSLSPALTLEVAKLLDIEQIYLHQQERKAAVAANPKPVRPDWYQKMWNDAPDEGRGYNGKVYGNSGRYNIYINNKQFDLTDEQKTELDAYMAQLGKYRAANK